MRRFSRILVPVAFSARCEGAAHYAEALACHFQAEVSLLHVVTPATAYGCPDAVILTPDLNEEIVARSQTELDGFVSEGFKGIAVKRIVLEGDAAQEIVRYAESENIDLIV